MMAHVDTAVRFVITALFSGLWQAPVFALAAWLVLRVRPNLNATTRHSVLAAALFASLALPIVTATVTSNAAPATPAPATLSRVANDAFVPANILPYKPGKSGATVPSRTNPGRTNPVLETPSPLLAVRSLARLNLALPRAVALGIVSVWVLGAGFVLLRLIISLGHLERLKRDALPLPVDYRAELTRWAAASKGSRTVRLCTSEEIEIPIAVGLFDAMILVPARLLEELAPADVDSIVLHELAHLRRSDDWVNAIERFTQAVLFFNPGISWLCAQLDLEREVACDDWVLQQNDALPYATCLAKVVETTVWPFRAMTAPGAFVTRRGMSIRIERLLSKHRDVRVHTSFGPAGAVVGLLAVLGIVAAFVSPSIAYSVTQVAGTGVTTIVVTNPQTHTKTVTLKNTERGHEGARPATASASAASSDTSYERAYSYAYDTSPYAKPHPDVHPNPNVHPNITIRTYRDSRSGDSRTDIRSDDSDVSVVAPIPPVTPITPITPITVPGKKVPHAELLAEANAPDYIDELESVGYKNLSVDDLVQLKAVGVTASFIRELQQQGFEHPSVSELVQYRAMGIDPAYVTSMRKRFGNHLSFNDLAGMKAVGVNTDYIDSLSAAGYKNVGANALMSLRALGVTPDYLRDLASQGYANLTVDQIEQFRALGIDRDFISHAASHGFHNLTVQQLINLKATGVL